ncbi:SDR family oxidoreductase [Salipaludibacillus sp. LMS25]|uniref:SDR family NAD(P)-dependent oxidoreductase n=1 Tax=Salipaludibacillus sp. LMS25 TaxID=2924031 RepID=UPI0020D118B2|nr:SDR family oxidoreductase [Salipaludibacillus sp. LMS25]UTR14536.1 SDR family oxidoreductase [Salipaludibacillus sp. LMS25]
MKKNLNKDIIVITGASGGIGKELAIEVAKQGGTPVLLARSIDKLRAVSEHICCTTGIKAPIYTLDVADLNAVETVFKAIYTEVGAISALINNAGFAVFDTVTDADLLDMENMFKVNVFGTIACTKQVLPYMIMQGYGHIIFIASVASKIPTPKASVYSATKHAVLGFANALRMELHNSPLHVSVVNPGPVRTDFFNVADKSGDYEKNVQSYMLEPAYVSKKTAHLLKKPKREINLPIWMGAGAILYQLCPTIFQKMLGKHMNKK